MASYRVGDLYSGTRRVWPEGGEYNYRAGAHELRLFWPRLSPTEVFDVTEGAAEFALFTDEDLIVLLYRFGRLPWGDAVYSWHLVQQLLPAEAAVPRPPEPGEQDRLFIVLVEATTGVIAGLRVPLLAPSFTAALRAAICRQAARPWPGRAAYDRQHAALYRRYPESRLLVPMASHRLVIPPKREQQG